MNRYAVIWNDGFPTTFFGTSGEAWECIRESEINGTVMTIEEYLQEV